jgi:hypothetical protein
MCFRLSALIVAAAFTFALPALADPTDIVQVPTGEIQAEGELLVGVTGEFDASDDPEVENGLALRSVFGFLPRFEGGFDIYEAQDDPQLRGNAAFQFIRPDSEGGASAKIGLDRIGKWEDTLGYVVSSYRTGQAQVTGGLGYRDDSFGFLLGGQLDLTDRLRLFGEYSSVTSDEARLGGSYALRPGLRGALYYGREDRGDDIVGVELNLTGLLQAR